MFQKILITKDHNNFKNTAMRTLHDYLGGKVRCMHTSTKSYSCSEYFMRTYRVHH